MIRYCALLRGINVGRANRITMEALRDTFVHAGFEQVRTYIQSGNVVFSAPPNADADQVAKRIADAILQRHEIVTDCIVRSREALRALFAYAPFAQADMEAAEQAAQGAETLYVALVQHDIAEDVATQLVALSSDTEQCGVRGADVYMLLHHSIRNAKLPAALARIGQPVTVRNMRTLHRVYDLMAE